MTIDIHAFGRMNATDRKIALGLEPTKHLPNSYLGIVTVHGVRMFLVERNIAINTFGASRNKPQRVMAECPQCKKVFAAGNLAQHYNTHTEGGRAMLARKAERTKERKNRHREIRSQARVEPLSVMEMIADVVANGDASFTTKGGGFIKD